jgi:DNA-binding MarR family transcriptional regulator
MTAQRHPAAAARRALSQRDYEVLAEFRHLLRRFLAFSEAAARDRGLTPQQHQALLAIKGSRRSTVTIGDLAERLDIRHHSAVGLVDRLVAHGLVGRQVDDADRRQVIVALTPAAEEVLADLTAAHRRELRQLAPNLRVLLGWLRDAADESEAPRQLGGPGESGKPR